MIRFFLRRISLLAVTIVGVGGICFFLLRLIPGDPVDFLLGLNAAESERLALRHELGLDHSPTAQFARYLARLAHFDFGRSIFSNESVSHLLVQAFPATLELTLASLSLAILMGLPLGVLSAIYRGGHIDRVVQAATLLAISLPGVFLGPFLVYVFSIQLEWLPVSERGGWEHLVLPALSLGLPLGGVLVRLTRTQTIEILGQDFVRTARAQGLGPIKLYLKYVLRNVWPPLITLIGLQLGALLTGTVITETLFDWPGLGSLLYRAISQRDLAVVQGTVLFSALIYMLVNFLADLLFVQLQPRLRLADQ